MKNILSSAAVTINIKYHTASRLAKEGHWWKIVEIVVCKVQGRNKEASLFDLLKRAIGGR